MTRLSTGVLHTIAALAVVIAMGIAADYGIGPVQAAAAMPATAAVATPPATAAGDSAESLVAAEAVGPNPGEGFVRLPGHVLAALASATPVVPGGSARAARHADTGRPAITLTLVLKRDHAAEFESYLNDVYDANSANFRHFLTQAQLSNRFGPSRETYAEVSNYLRHAGFHVVHGSKNHMTLTVRAPRAVVEHALALHVGDYQVGAQRFYATDNDPRLPSSIAQHVQAISGLSNLARPVGTKKKYPALWSAFCGFPGTSTGVGAGSAGVTSGAYYAATSAGAFGRAEAAFLSGGIFGAILAFAALEWSVLCWVDTANWPQTSKQYNSFMSGASGGGGHKGVKATKNVNLHSKSEGLAAAAATTSPVAAIGRGQTIGLVEFDTYQTSDVVDYLNYIGGSSTAIVNLSEVPVNGGAVAGPDQDEVLLDIDTVMSIAPGATVVVYDAPFDGKPTSYATVFNAMIDGGVSIISNSWSSCEDQMSLAEAQGIDAVLQTAAASGISVFNGAGDSGSTCLDGTPNTVGVPADSPNATAVGGTTLTLGAGYSYQSETWWNGSAGTPPTGQGGYGVSKFFAAPAYQATATQATARSVPDVAIDADPQTGMVICQASGGGCPTGSLYGGTSLAAPEWAAYAALLNEALGKNLGAVNPSIYPYVNSVAFHTASSMGSDFQHVGLGSPNIDALFLALSGTTAGVPSAAVSAVIPVYPATLLLNDQENDFSTTAVPSDGTPGQVLVQLYDANGNTVSGKTVTLAASAGHATITPAGGGTTNEEGTAAFTIGDLTAESVTFTATDTTDGIQPTQTAAITFSVPAAVAAGIDGNPGTVAADGQTPATIIVTLKDSLNRPTPGKTVILSNGGTSSVMTGPVPGVTNANGQIQFSATDLVAEAVTFTAVDVTDGSLPVPGSATVTYSNSTATSCNFGVTPVAAPGYSITGYIFGFPAATSLYYGNVNFGCTGAGNPTFTSNGSALTVDFLTGGIYQTGAAGGTVSTSNLLGTVNPAISNLVYGKDGSLYYAQSGEGGFIAQIDPSTGAQLRVVAAGLTCPAGLAFDPLSGDLFFDDECTNGGTDDPTIYRIIDPANSDTSRPTAVVAYATLPQTPNGSLAFAPNGTLYAVSGYYYSDVAPVQQISGTNATTVTVTPVTGVTSDFGIAIGATNADGSAQSLIVEPAGTLSEVPIATPSTATVIATGGPGVGVIGPDGCMYTSHYTVVYRLASTTGGCSFTPTSPAPTIKLTPATVSPNATQGSTQALTATLQNVGTPSGIAVSFLISGVNAQSKLTDANASGAAPLTYTGLHVGVDRVTATAAFNGTILASNTVSVTWAAGKHVTFLSLNSSPQGGTVALPVTVGASLTDSSVSPAAAIAGQTVSFTLAGATCTARTNSSGVATCNITPAQPGIATLTATFAGNGTLAAATDSTGLSVSVGPTPTPTVSIAVSPTSIAAGAPATLTWSSTNATSCTASGSWSGGEATSGSQSVTPPANGSYSYTLSCAGAGGTGTATAVLAATLVAVNVTAKSGGGAMTWYLLLALGLLVLLRWKGTRVFAATALLTLALTCMVPNSAGADENDALYAGIRVGSMPIRQDSSKIDAGLASLGFPDVTASSDISGAAGTVFLGYEFTSYAAVELGYTFRDSTTAHLTGTIPSVAKLTALLQDTTELTRGYGNIVSLSYAGRFEVAPRFTLEPRLGGFFWATKAVAVSFDDRIDTTHEGAGITAGLTAAYRVWRRLEIGISADHFHGFPNNVATLYAGTLEWRFGP